MIALADLLGRLHGVRPAGDGWVARCPAHQDNSPSASIHQRNGKILLHCFAGCTVEDICKSLEIGTSDLFWESRVVKSKPRSVYQAERQIADLRSRLIPRERVLPVTVVYCDRQNLNAGFARAIALAIEGEIVQCVLDQDKDQE